MGFKATLAFVVAVVAAESAGVPASAQPHRASIVLPNGDRANGPVADDFLSGPGTYVFADGLHVYGTFRHGRMRGPVRYGKAGGTTYQGTVAANGIFFNFTGPVDALGRPNGYGTSRYADGDVLTGRWEHGRMIGRFVDRLSDGDKIAIEVSPASDVLRGPATVSLTNGDSELGRLDQTALEGPGVYIDSFTGNRISGRFVHGVLQGPATLLTPEGETFPGVEKDGIFYQ